MRRPLAWKAGRRLRTAALNPHRAGNSSMPTRRSSIVVLTLLSGFVTAHQASAGCCDWLFGRKETPVVVGYAPVAVPQPVVVAQPPACPQPVPACPNPCAEGACPQPVLSGRVAVPTAAPVVVNRVPAAAPMPLSTGAPAPIAVTNGAVQAQRPAYHNPSVYTGLPVTSFRAPVAAIAPVQAVAPVTAYRPVVQAYAQPNPIVPVARGYRGIAPAATGNPIYGTGNVYPNNYQSVRYQAAYAAAAPATAPACPTPCPPTDPCATCPTPVVAPAPVVVAAPPKKCCGLSRFFGSCFGKTNYQTTYYRAPITYYRPVTSVDPCSGQTVTVQQPCTSTVQQIQRTPYNSLFGQTSPAPATVTPMTTTPMTTTPSTPMTVTPAPKSDCGSCGSSSAPSQYMGPSVTTTPPVGSGVGQTGAITSPSDQSVMPIPSTGPNYGSGGATQPLQGGSGGGDLQRIPQPRLESARPPLQPSEPAKREVEDSYWDQRNGEQTAMQSLGGNQSAPQSYSNVRPIEAPRDYRAPVVQHSVQQPPASTAPASPNLTAPPLLPRPTTREFDLRDSNSASLRVTAPIREAKLTRSMRLPLQSQVRDAGGWQAND